MRQYTPRRDRHAAAATPAARDRRLGPGDVGQQTEAAGGLRARRPLRLRRQFAAQARTAPRAPARTPAAPRRACLVRAVQGLHCTPGLQKQVL